ncbi:MAG: cupin domain-containing protein [Edaphobacter sp.]
MATSLRNAWILTFATLLVPAVSAAAQATGSVYTNAQVMVIGHKLEATLKTGAEPSGLLEEKLDDSTRVAVRIKSGRAELHPSATDVFFVLSGEATLISGGTIVNAQGSGEIRGDSINDGKSIAMHKGDVVHIPPATPHQVIMKAGTTFIYIVVKIASPQAER